MYTKSSSVEAVESQRGSSDHDSLLSDRVQVGLDAEDLFDGMGVHPVADRATQDQVLLSVEYNFRHPRIDYRAILWRRRPTTVFDRTVGHILVVVRIDNANFPDVNLWLDPVGAAVLRYLDEQVVASLDLIVAISVDLELVVQTGAS